MFWKSISPSARGAAYCLAPWSS